MRASMEALNALGRQVREAHLFTLEHGEKVASKIIAERWAATDAGLLKLGIQPHRPDQYGRMNGQPHAWHTAQDVRGHIFGMWSGSPEQAAAELAESHGHDLVWCVRDWTDDLKSPLIEHYRAKYTTRANEQPIVAPVTVTPEPLEAPAPPEPSLFDGMGWTP